MLTDYVLQVPQTVYGGLHALENVPKAIQGAKKAAVDIKFLGIRAGKYLNPCGSKQDASCKQSDFFNR